MFNATTAGPLNETMATYSPVLRPENETDVMWIHDINNKNHLVGKRINQRMVDGFDGLFWFNNKTKTSVTVVKVYKKSILIIGK